MKQIESVPELQRMLATTSQALAQVSEDLAIEILAEFSEDDLPHLSKSLDRLQAAEQALTETEVAVPRAITVLLGKYRAFQSQRQ